MTFEQYKWNILQDPRSKKLDFNKSDDRSYYVYRITDLETGMHYYGSRRTTRNPKDDLGVRYFSTSSNKEFKDKQKNKPELFKYKILKIYNNPADMILYESFLHKKLDVVKNEMFINKGNQTPFKFDGINNKGKVTIKDKDGNTFRVDSNDPRFISGELVHITKGKRNALVVSTGKIIQTSVDDPRFKTGELQSQNKNKRLAIDKDGERFMTDSNDPRFKTGEIRSPAEGMFNVRDTETGKVFRAKTNDPRLLTGEIEPFWKGRKHSEEARKKMSEHAKTRSKTITSNSNLFIIYNDKKQIFKVFIGDFIKKGKSLGMPVDSFNVSAKTGKPISGRYEVSKPYKGFTAVKMKLHKIKWSVVKLH